MTVRTAVAEPPLTSKAVTRNSLDPLRSAMGLAVQLVVPFAGPLPPCAFIHSTRAIPEEWVALPAGVTDALVVVYVLLRVGERIRTSGGSIGSRRVMTAESEACAELLSVAVTVTVLTPVSKGRAVMVHARPPAAIPA